MPKIYISYRRQDGAPYAGRLTGALERHFGPGAVLRTEHSISAGDDWAEAQRWTLRSCTLMLVVIGPGWMSADDGSGRRRLENPDDSVRIELAFALQREIPVVPVLVGGASFPRLGSLPADIAGLSLHPETALRDDDWDADIAKLFEVLTRLSGKDAGQVAPAPAAPLASAATDDAGPDAFISHASEDHALAELIVAGLEQQGQRCWMAPRDIPPGTNSYARAITRAIKTSRLMVVIVSTHANQSDDVLNEITLAKNYKVPRLPVRIDAEPLDDGLAYYFSQSQWLDVPNLSHKEVAQRLIALLRDRKPRSL